MAQYFINEAVVTLIQVPGDAQVHALKQFGVDRRLHFHQSSVQFGIGNDVFIAKAAPLFAD